MAHDENSWDAPIRFLDEEYARIEREQQKAVKKLRADGVTWNAIGKALGVSRQAAQQRFSDR